MAKIKVKFPDGSEKEFEKGISAKEVAESIGPGLARAALAAKVNDTLTDLTTTINEDADLRFVTFKDDEGVEIFRHSSAHIMAAAVLKLFPEAQPTIGPAVEDGFYYDFDHRPFNPEDLEEIEKEMKKIVSSDLPFERIELTKEKALEMFSKNKFKTEMINEMEGDISAYRLGDFVDLCRGPHVPSSGCIKAFKLTKVAGAYWRGDSNREQLQRIYGTSFPDKKELNKYLKMMEEAEKRDHRKIGKKLDLFSFHEEAPGMPFWHPKGTIIYRAVEQHIREENACRGYNELMTPTILNSQLWHVSGHWDNFKENMYFTRIDDKDYAVKPMNCPGGLLIYKTRVHSYRELPLKNAEFGYVHRHELSGVLSGLLRVRAFTQDDAHCFCTEEQMQAEIIDMVDYAVKIYNTFGFPEFQTFIATKPDKAIGSNEVWERATDALVSALKELKMDYKMKEGEGAFYGPKIEFNIKDAIGRYWQCGTIQVDFSMPARFNATYEAQDGTKKTPVMIHRAILGSLERFIGTMIENYAGKFPLWLSPVQVIILTVADRFNDYALEVQGKLKDSGIRVEVDTRQESVPKKVRDAQEQQINYICVVGEKEQKDGTVTVRTRANEVTGPEKVTDFAAKLVKEIKDKS